jgi:hypothetical protein
VAVLLAASGVIRIHSPLPASLEVGGAAVARINTQSLRSMASLDRDAVQHRQQMHRISGLVADANPHDHLMVPIDGCLAVMALNPNVTTLKDVVLRSPYLSRTPVIVIHQVRG